MDKAFSATFDEQLDAERHAQRELFEHPECPAKKMFGKFTEAAQKRQAKL
jgi:hypothetical protein